MSFRGKYWTAVAIVYAVIGGLIAAAAIHAFSH